MTRRIRGTCRFIALFALAALAVRCSTDKSGLGSSQDGATDGRTDGAAKDQSTRSGGATGTGEQVSSGGNSGTRSGGTAMVGSGGHVGSGGITSIGTGGRTGSGGITSIGTGGTSATGGVVGTGGVSATGGATGSGGVSATGGTPGTGGVTTTGGTPGTGGLTGTGGTQGVDGGRLCPYPTSSTCCYLDEDCSGNRVCVGGACSASTPAKGVCKSITGLAPDDCWRDSDCSSPGESCQGVVICGCEEICPLIVDEPGTCTP